MLLAIFSFCINGYRFFVDLDYIADLLIVVVAKISLVLLILWYSFSSSLLRFPERNIDFVLIYLSLFSPSIGGI